MKHKNGQLEMKLQVYYVRFSAHVSGVEQVSSRNQYTQQSPSESDMRVRTVVNLYCSLLDQV